MYSKAFVKRIGAAALSLTMAVSLLPMVRAADPIVDESYYGTLDYYGALTEGSVVKSYRLNGNTDLADIGSYTEVNNLTDRTEPVIEGDRVTFHLTDESLKSFYFEGKTDKPFREMPFLISISYKMNGVETDAENMAGQTGLAEITLDVRPNPLASAYQRNNFALEAAAVLKDSDLLSIEAPGGQLQKVGDLDTALYVVLPGETRSFTLRIGAEDFSFPGFTFMVQPATLAQLDQIKELKEAKEELEGAAQDLSDSLDAILTSLEGMDGDLRQTSAGLDQLDRARAVISTGKSRVYDRADRTLASLTDLTESLKPAVEHIKTSKEALAESAQQLADLTESVDGLRPELQDLRADLTDLQRDMNGLHATLELLQSDGRTAEAQLGLLSGDLGELKLRLEAFKGDTDAIARDLNALSTDLDSVRDDLDVLQRDLQRVSTRTGDLRRSVSSLKGLDARLNTIDSIPIGDTSYSPAEIRTAKAQMDGMPATETTERVPGIYDICVALGYDDSAHLLLLNKELALTQFIMTNAEAITMAIVRNDPEQQAAMEQEIAQAMEQALPAAAAQVAAQRMAALYPDLPPDSEAYAAAYQAIYQAVLADEDFQNQVRAQVIAGAQAQALDRSGLDREDRAQMLSLLHYQWDAGVNISQQLDNLDQFNSFITAGNARIAAFNQNLASLTASTASLLQALEALMDDVDKDSIDNAQDILIDSQDLLSSSRSALLNTRDTLDTAGNTLTDTQALLETARTLIDRLTSYDIQALNQHANSLFDTGVSTVEKLDGIVEQTAQLSQTITDYEPDAQAALDDASLQVSNAVALLEDLNTFSRSLEDLLQTAGPDLDQGAASSLRGLSATLRRAADGLGTTSTVRRAKETITRLVEDKWDQYTGGENNLLNMDSQATMVSLTSPENPSPNTITLVLRSQEIKTEDETARSDSGGSQEPEKLGFWGRVGRMFHDLAAIFTGDE